MRKIQHAVYRIVDHTNDITLEDAIEIVADLFCLDRAQVEQAVYYA